jgi:peptidoglycan/xylan/chitin deacetylase (PgdA/CDA1 family)
MKDIRSYIFQQASVMKFVIVILVLGFPSFCLGYLSADLNRDGTVDFHDFAILADQWLKVEDQNNLVDLNRDRTVDFYDFTILASQWLSVEEPVEFVTCLARKPIASNPCDDHTLWTVTYATKENDLTNFTAYKNPPRSIKFAPTGTTYPYGSILYTYTVPQDWRDCKGNPPFVFIRFFVPEGSGPSLWSNISQIYLRLRGTNLSDQFAAKMFILSYWWPGWYKFVITPEGFTKTGSPSWNNIKQIEFQIATKALGQTPSVTLDQVSILPRPIQPVLMLMFDDIKKGQMDIANYLASKNIKATFYASPFWLGLPGRLTLSQLHEIHDMGHLIANHGYAHLNWTDYTDQQVINDIELCKAWMLAEGFTEGTRIYALPGGSPHWKPRGLNFFLDSLVDSARITRYQAGRECRGLMWYRNDFLYTDAADNTVTATQSLNCAIADHSASIALFHWREIDGVYTWADLQSYIDLVAEKRDAGLIKIITPLDAEEPPECP